MVRKMIYFAIGETTLEIEGERVRARIAGGCRLC
jgi:hypothetical protein